MQDGGCAECDVDSGGEDFEVRTIGIGAKHGALVRVRPSAPGSIDDVEPHVADLPVDPSVWPERQPRNAVPAEGGMDVVALADGHLRIDEPVAVGIAQPPERGRGAEKQVALVVEHAAGDVEGRIGAETLDHDLRAVRYAVAVCILDSIEPLFHLREIAPVARAVVVGIEKPGVRGASFRRELAAIEGPQIVHGSQCVHHRHPGRVRADVERQVHAGGARGVERSRAVEVERHGIEHQALGRPRRHLEAWSELHGDAATGRGREAMGLHR